MPVYRFSFLFSLFLSLFPSLLSHNLLFVPILSSAKYKYNGYVTSRKFSPVFHIQPLLHSSISLHLTWLTCFSAIVFAPTPLSELLHTKSAFLGLCSCRQGPVKTSKIEYNLILIICPIANGKRCKKDQALMLYTHALFVRVYAGTSNTMHINSTCTTGQT